MYSLVVLLAMAFATTFALAYMHERRRWLAGFVVAGALLVYSHNWGLFVVVGSAVALLPLLRKRRAR